MQTRNAAYPWGAYPVCMPSTHKGVDRGWHFPVLSMTMMSLRDFIVVKAIHMADFSPLLLLLCPIKYIRHRFPGVSFSHGDFPTFTNLNIQPAPQPSSASLNSALASIHTITAIATMPSIFFSRTLQFI